MDENQQNKTESKLAATEDKSISPPLSSKDQRDEKEAQEELARLRKRLRGNEKSAFKTTLSWTGFEGKTLWDWLQLLGILAIPLVVVAATIFFGMQQANLADQQHQSDQKLAVDQQQEATLTSYLNDISDLLLKDNLGNSKLGDEVRQVARVRTLTTLRRLNADRNQIVLQFLRDAHLIAVNNATIDLSNASLNTDDLSFANLADVDLSGDSMFVSKLSFANLSDANLSGANLAGVDLSLAKLIGADLSGTFLGCADLSGQGICTNLSVANLSGANLSGAYLGGAVLIDANLSGAIITQQQLDQVNSCKDAILPPGLTCHRNS